MANPALFLLLTCLALSASATNDTETKSPFVPGREPPTTSATPTTKKVTPTPESRATDVTKPFVVHAQSAGNVLPNGPFRPLPQLQSRSDSFTGSEPTFDVQLASSLPEQPKAPPPSPPVTTQRSYARPPRPVAPYPYVVPARLPQPHPVRAPVVRRVPIESLNRPPRHPGPRGPSGPPPRPPPSRPHLIYSKPPPEVIYYGDEPPPLDYEPPTIYRPRRPSSSAYYSKPIPPEDEQDIMNILDHYIPDEEHPIRKKEESSSSGMSRFMLPMMLMGVTVNLFSLMYNMLLRGRRRRRRDLTDQPKLVQQVHDAIDKFEEKIKRKS
ncbi:uncharacterized protein LOC132193817 [Neocloeon triangulifer]|uniref:uncharacterized protein LOC132193817 n=1 Tax=Neocloeon triangulifer TaxID=2078957 RepID=UPI00286EFA9A|nr:uncharacterized protein LOC132193817 [Neocloeon triangulifer]